MALPILAREPLLTAPPNATRKPFDPAGYAALRAGDVNAHEGPKAETAAGDRNDLAAEAQRLNALREALWEAFTAGPEAGLPDALIDLTMAYTGSLRLQLSLRAANWRHSLPKPRPTPRPHSPFKTKGDVP